MWPSFAHFAHLAVSPLAGRWFYLCPEGLLSLSQIIISSVLPLSLNSDLSTACNLALSPSLILVNSLLWSELIFKVTSSAGWSSQSLWSPPLTHFRESPRLLFQSSSHVLNLWRWRILFRKSSRFSYMPFAFVYFYIYVLNHLEFIFVHCIGWGLFNSLNMLALCWNILSLPFTHSFN